MTLPAPKQTGTDKLKGALATREEPRSIEALIQTSVKELGRALPKEMSADKLARVALTCIRLNPELAKTTPESFLGSLFVLAQLGLQPGVAGQAYLLPFKNNRKVGNEWKSVYETQCIVGYKGLISLFYRHNSALSIEVKTVYTNDFFDFQYGSEGFLKHRPSLTDRGETIAYYAIAKLKGGGSSFHVMSKAECMAHGQEHSKTYDRKVGKFYDSSPWAKEFDSMAMKTVLIQLSKTLPLSVELQKAISIDETSREFRKDIDNALDLPSTTNWEPSKDVSENAAIETTSEPIVTEGFIGK